MNWGPLVGEIASWLLSLGITGAVAAAGALGLFRWLGERWIANHFSKELEDFKAEKQLELERLRTDYGRETERLKADLNLFAGRASLFHVREYEVLPEAWGLMNKAYGAAASTISSFSQHPDLNNMGSAQFTEWLGHSGLDEYQKEQLSLSSDRLRDYMKMRNWKQIGEAKSAVTEFVNYVILQGVFINEELSEKMMTAGLNMHKAIISRSMAEQTAGMPYAPGQTNFWEEASGEIQSVAAVVSEVKQEVRKLLSNIRLAPPATEPSAAVPI